MRVATAADCDALTSLYLRNRRAGLPWLATAHSEASTRAWMEHIVVTEQHVIVVEERSESSPSCPATRSRLLGFAALHEDWLQQLWVDPAVQGCGHGSHLLAAAKEHSPTGLHLHVFARNERARAFYERAGFRLTGGESVPGEDGEPEVTYSWVPPAAQPVRTRPQT